MPSAYQALDQIPNALMTQDSTYHVATTGMALKLGQPVPYIRVQEKYNELF